jgi:ribonuclease VapC
LPSGATRLAMSKVVLDSSAVLALFNREPGSEKLTSALLKDSSISSVNVAEVHGKLLGLGSDSDEAWEAIEGVVREIVPFTATHARVTAELVSKTRSHGLSLGDRACLALALTLKAPVYTADRAWSNLKFGFPIHVIR